MSDPLSKTQTFTLLHSRLEEFGERLMSVERSHNESKVYLATLAAESKSQSETLDKISDAVTTRLNDHSVRIKAVEKEATLNKGKVIGITLASSAGVTIIGLVVAWLRGGP
jgi:hypothetical protein